MTHRGHDSGHAGRGATPHSLAAHGDRQGTDAKRVGPPRHPTGRTAATLFCVASLAGCASMAWAQAAPAAAATQKPASAGAYTDHTGARHDWSVSPSHTLVWNGKAYLPAGVRFVPGSLAPGSGDEAWERDRVDLATLKRHGITDVLIDPGVSMAATTAGAWQRLIDHLDSEGFLYGLTFGKGVATDLTGIVVNPAAYRIGDLQDGATAGWDVPEADSGWYVIVDGRDGTQVQAEGRARVRDGHASVTAAGRISEGSVAILYPRKTLPAGPEGSLPDLWAGFDAYRDRVLNILGQVRFGPGLRFFADPLGEKIGLPNEADYLVPDSPGWRLEWEAFLARKYSSSRTLGTAWGLVDDLHAPAAEGNTPSKPGGDFTKAARLVPLWSRNKGVPFLLDPSDGRRYQVSGAESRFWTDLRECRDQSMAYYLHAMAELIKREIADAPVAYTHSLHHSMFAVRVASGGFDGLGISAHGTGSRLVQAGGDAAYSQVVDAAKNLWLVTLDTSNPTGPGGSARYSSREALFRDMDWLAGVGSRGVFIGTAPRTSGNPVQPTDPRSLLRSPAGLRWDDLDKAPEPLQWLRDYAARLNSAGSAPAGGPRALPFPVAASGYVQSGPIGNGSVWWIPSLAPGRALDFGSSYAGYTITLPEGETIVLWSLTGPRDTQLHMPDPRRLDVRTPEGLPVEFKPNVKERIARLVVTETPILIRAQGQEVFPIEAVEDSINQLRALVNQALAEKLPAHDHRYMLDTAESRLKRKDPASAFGICQQALAGIVELMQPYSWCEVEHAAVQTFTEVVPVAGASAGMYLSLNATGAPPRDGYSFQVRFRVPADDTYTAWLACSPQSPAASPFAWVVDTGETRLSSEAKPVGGTFLGDRLGWMELGRMPLKAGDHTFTLRVTDRASATGAFAFAADVLLVTRQPFTPRGTARPPASAGRP